MSDKNKKSEEAEGLTERDEIEQFIKKHIVTTSDVCEILHIKRQRLNAIVKSGRLLPLKCGNFKCSLFLRTDIDEYINKKNSSLVKYSETFYKLAEYEKIGLSPEEIIELLKSKEEI